MPDIEPTSRLSRRELIARAGVGASIIWVAPVIETFNSRAFGQASGSVACTVTPNPVCTGFTVSGRSLTLVCTFDADQVACTCCCSSGGTDTGACASCSAYTGTAGNPATKLAAACAAGQPTCEVLPQPCNTVSACAGQC